jgi:hypothetical protein
MGQDFLEVGVFEDVVSGGRAEEDRDLDGAPRAFSSPARGCCSHPLVTAVA